MSHFQKFESCVCILALEFIIVKVFSHFIIIIIIIIIAVVVGKAALFGP
jgi:hypothetical protein